MLLKIWVISHEITCVGVCKSVTLFKKTPPTQVFSCEIFKNFKNTYLQEHLGTTASERLRKISPLLVLGNAVLDGKRHN